MANILLIDDMLPVRRALTTLLESENHRVTQAQDGAQGIHCLITQKFDLVITDILMPRADGLEILNHIEAMPSKPPVIAISGGSISMSADHALI
ncbi:MAG TPA: response regulator, partial [Alphaproteobacteria bacterium]|nr:response regulator [Alphaproteobacteria bacterium]